MNSFNLCVVLPLACVGSLILGLILGVMHVYDHKPPQGYYIYSESGAHFIMYSDREFLEKYR